MQLKINGLTKEMQRIKSRFKKLSQDRIKEIADLNWKMKIKEV
jgi:hypothetical protein